MFLKEIRYLQSYLSDSSNPCFVVETVFINGIRPILYKTFTDILHVFKVKMETHMYNLRAVAAHSFSTSTQSSDFYPIGTGAISLVNEQPERQAEQQLQSSFEI
jgi:hypothetical protein